MSSREDYRSDIDGLRALAVLAIVLYHFKVGGWSGGFVGVDIFFVISGYLITGIISREIVQGRFRFSAFYARRIRRLFPALIATIIVTIAVGAFILLPSDLVAAGRAGAATLVFGANIYFWRTTGYFEASAEANPLLHMWSLAVEEQFYLGLPLLLIAVHRWMPRRVVPVLAGCAVASFLLCVLVQELRPTASFYLSPMRAWELLAGALLAVGAVPVLRPRWIREAVACIGLMLILGAMFTFHPGPEFPGALALAPVLGTAALIHTGSSGGAVVNEWLKARPLVLIGLISYSLYLWHWPVLVYAKYSVGFEPLGPERLLWLGLSVGLAALSYRFIERPFRDRERRVLMAQGPRWLAGAAVGMALLALGIGLGSGWPARFDVRTVQLDRERDPDIPYLSCIDRPQGTVSMTGLCRVGDAEAPPALLVWGDSYSLAWLPALHEVLDEQGVSALYAARSACPPLAGVISPANPLCAQFNDDVLAFVRQERVQAVLLIASWVRYSQPVGFDVLRDTEGRRGNAAVFPVGLQRTVDELKAAGVARILVAGPTPGAPGDAPFRMAMASAAGRDASMPPAVGRTDFEARRAPFLQALEPLAAAGRIEHIDPSPWFCDALRCAFEEGGLPLYRDGGHLNLRGARRLLPHLRAHLSGLGGGAGGVVFTH